MQLVYKLSVFKYIDFQGTLTYYDEFSFPFILTISAVADPEEVQGACCNPLPDHYF